MDYTIEPELICSVPRRTSHRKRSLLILTILYRFAIVLLIGLGILLFAYFCMQLSLGMSKPIVGTITAIKNPPPEPAENPEQVPAVASGARNAINPPVPTLEYAFTVNNRQLEGSTRIMPAQINLLPPGNAIRIRALPFLAELGNRPILPNDTFWGWVGWLGLGTLVTEIVIYSLCWFAFVVPRTHRELCRYGLPAVGTIMRKEVWGSGANSYVVHYRFETKPITGTEEIGQGQKRERQSDSDKPEPEVLGQMRISQELWEKLDAGDKVTVLYSRKNPEKNVLYEPCLYEAISTTHAVVRVREDARVSR